MFARVSTYELPQGRADDAVASFRTALADIETMPGLVDGYMFVSEDGAEALTMTLWDTHDAMAGSRVRASRLRSTAAEAVDSVVRSTIEYRVAVHARNPSPSDEPRVARIATISPEDR